MIRCSFSHLRPWGNCVRAAGELPSQSPSGDSVSAAASVGRWATSHRDVAAPEGGAKSRLPPWGRWTRVSEDGEGKVPAAPSHGLCGNVGRLPSQSRLPPCQLPRRGSQVGTQPEVCRKPSLASPFGGRWCPVGTVQRLTEPAGESVMPKAWRRGQGATGRERRFAVSLVPF